MKRGIQVDTCYSYEGEIANDQGLDVKNLNKNNYFFLILVYVSSHFIQEHDKFKSYKM